jgi:hypothetical protein
MAFTQSITGSFFGLLGKPYGVNALSGGRGILIGHALSPFVSAYPWTDQVGFGVKYADPATLPAAQVQGAVFSPFGETVFLAFASTPFLSAYPWSVATGFGTKFANPVSLPSGSPVIGLAVRAISTESAYSIATCDDNAGSGPFISVWKFNRNGTGWGTRFANPATLPPDNAADCAFSPDGSALAVAHATTPFVSAYPFSATGFGTKFANPAALSAAAGTGVAFSPPGTALALSHGFNASSVSVSAWGWSVAGFGTKYADATGLPGGGAPSGLFASYTAANNALAIGHGFNGTIGGFTAYRWTEASGFGTVYAQITPLITGNGNSGKWNQAGTSFFGSLSPAPFMTARRWTTAGGFGSAYANPATTPPSTGWRVAIAA